jgi:hypothetical protein
MYSRIIMRLPYRVLLLSLCLCLSPFLSAQAPSSSDSQSSDDNKSWTATSDQQGPSGAGFSPTRTSESHTHTDGRTVDKQTVELRGSDGTYQPLRDIERESIRVDASTTRNVERVYGRGPDGQRMLIQVREEESRTLPGGDQKVTRTTSNPDANGSLEVVQRELQETRKSSPDVEKTKTTVLMPDLNGGFSPISQSEETNTRKSATRVDFHKTTSVPDGNGGWQLQEVREGSVNDEADKTHTREERVLRPATDGNLTLIKRTVSKETQNAPGESRQTVEDYSADLPGTANDGTLHLNKRITTVHRTGADGGQVSEEQVEQPDPAAPGEPPRLTQKTIDIVSPGTGNASTHIRTVQGLDGNGDLSTVWVDTRKTETAPSVQVDTKQANAPASVTVDTKSPPKQQ